MTDPNLESNEGENLEMDAGPQHVEVAPPVADEAPPPPPPAMAGPRNVPQHFSLLFGCICVLVGAFGVWEREHVFGAEIEGTEKLAGAILIALAGYSSLIGAMNVLQGRLRGMMAMFSTAFFALYFGIPALNATYAADGTVTMDEIKAYHKASDAGGVPPVPDRFREPGNVPFPAVAIEGVSRSWQGPMKYFIGQFAPGPIMTVFGGLLLIWVFLKGIFGGKKKAEPAPAPSRGRGGRRR